MKEVIYNPQGFRQDGTYLDTGLKYDKNKFTIDRINVVTKKEVDIRGFSFKGRFRPEGFLCYRRGKLTFSNTVTMVKCYDEWGFKQDGTHIKTGEKYKDGYNCFGVDKNGRMKDGKLHPDLRFAIAYIKGMQSMEKDNPYMKMADDYIKSKLKNNIPGMTAEDYIRIILEAAGQMYPEIKSSIILGIRSMKREIANREKRLEELRKTAKVKSQEIYQLESENEQLMERLQSVRDAIEF